MPEAVTPEQEVADLQRQRQSLALDALEGHAGAAEQLAIVEQRLDKLQHQIWYEHLAGLERERRTQDRQERQRQQRITRLEKELTTFVRSRREAMKKLDQAATQMGECLKLALELNSKVCDATVALAVLQDEETTGLEYRTSAKPQVENRLVWIMRHAGLSTGTLPVGYQPAPLA